MATYRLNNMNFSFSVRRAPKSGPTSSDKWNDTMDEISRDLANIALEWNQKLVPIIEGLPDGADDTTINAFVNGLDGANVWTDSDSAADVQGGRYYNSVRARPNTVKEQFEAVYSHFSNELVTVQANIISSAGLTDEAKARIGANIFDTAAVSSATSLDGVSANNAQNIIQLSVDLYGDDAALNNDGNAILVNSLKDMVDALLQLHNGAWDDDVSLTHVGVVTVTQNDVGTSHPGNDLYTGIPADLLDDLNRIRSEIRELRGTAGWQAAHTPLYTGGADSIEDLLTSTQGTGTKDATNPWGYHYNDIDDLVTVLEATRDFVGKDSHTDSTPDYGVPTFISNGDDLVTAMSGVDATLASQSGVIVANAGQLAALQIFTGQDDPADTTPTYTSAEIIDQGMPLEEAIGILDSGLFVQSGLDLGVHEHLDTLQAYVGQDDPTDSGAFYTSAVFIEDEQPLDDAISTLDSVLAAVSGLAYEGDREFNTVLVGGFMSNPWELTFDDVSVAASGHVVTASGNIIAVSGDLQVLNSGAGLVIYAPNGTGYRVQVDDAGSLLTTAI